MYKVQKQPKQICGFKMKDSVYLWEGGNGDSNGGQVEEGFCSAYNFRLLFYLHTASSVPVIYMPSCLCVKLYTQRGRRQK